MAKQFTNTVSPNHFSSGSNLHRNADERANSLVALVRQLLRNNARRDVDAAAVAALIDSSGGTAGVVYTDADAGVFSDNDLTGLTTGVQAAAFNTAADTYTAAYREIVTKANEVLDEIDPTSQIDVGPGAATDGTIDAITVAVTANTGNTDAATYASAIAVQSDLLHAQRTAIHALDDVLTALDLPRALLNKRGSFDGTGTLTFSTGPDRIARTTGSWITDGFRKGDVVEIKGTDLNNVEGKAERRTVDVVTALNLDFVGTGFSAETPSAGESALIKIEAVKSVPFAGRLAGGDPGPGLTETSAGGSGFGSPAGADWTLEFLTGTSAISDAVNGADATSAVLKTEVDAFLAELANNIALMNDQLDTIVAVAAAPIGVFASI